MSVLDIFNNDAFKTTSMLATNDFIEYQPTRMSSMGIFTETPVRTESVAIEARSGVLKLIQTSQRGSPLGQRDNEKRNVRDFRTTRIAEGDRIKASELAFIRGYGETEQVAMVQEEVARRLNGPTGIMANIQLTMEHMRLGAVQGIVLDADGSSIINWFDAFGVSAATEIDFDLDNATPVDGALREQCTQVTRAMKRAAQGAWNIGTRIHGLCGDAFYDNFIKHPEIRKLFLNRDQSMYVEGGGAYEQFTYGGITFENYQGTDDGSTVAIGTDKIKFFPVNTPGVFREVYSPGEQFEHIGKMGQSIYPMVVRDLKRDSYVDIEGYTYPLHVCTRPAMLQSGRRT